MTTVSRAYLPLDRATFTQRLLDTCLAGWAAAEGQTVKQIQAQIASDQAEARKYQNKPEETLESALNHAARYHALGAQVNQDVSTIVFDFENVLTAYDNDRMDRMSSFRGIHEGPGGLVYYGLEAGGDWEWPVAFILYFDETGLRAYVPEQGNAFNKKTRTAYGSEDESRVVADEEPCDDAGDLPKRLQAKPATMHEDIQVTFGLAAPKPAPTNSGDCKTLLDTDPTVKAAGAGGPWKRLSKTGNAQVGITRIFQGKTGFVQVLEKDGELTVAKVGQRLLDLDAPPKKAKP